MTDPVGDDSVNTGGIGAPPSGETRSLLRASALPAVGTTLSRVTGLIRVAALTSALGLTAVSDVYNLANTTPNILYELVIGGVLSSTLVPLFIRSLDDPNDDTASAVTTVAFAAIAVVTVVAVLLSPLINLLFAAPLHGAERARQLAIGADFLAILLPQILFYGITTLITALLYARRRFAPPAFAPVLTNLVTAAAALASAYWVHGRTHTSITQVYVLGLGTTAGVAAMAIVLVPYVRKAGIELRWKFQPKHPAVRAVLRLSGWTVGFAAANQIALLIVLTIARTGIAGTVSAYQYAFIFFQLPHGLIAVSLMTAVLPGTGRGGRRSGRGAVPSEVPRRPVTAADVHDSCRRRIPVHRRSSRRSACSDAATSPPRTPRASRRCSSPSRSVCRRSRCSSTAVEPSSPARTPARRSS